MDGRQTFSFGKLTIFWTSYLWLLLLKQGVEEKLWMRSHNLAAKGNITVSGSWFLFVEIDCRTENTTDFNVLFIARKAVFRGHISLYHCIAMPFSFWIFDQRTLSVYTELRLDSACRADWLSVTEAVLPGRGKPSRPAFPKSKAGLGPQGDDRSPPFRLVLIFFQLS
jgi:hypothetical protein